MWDGLIDEKTAMKGGLKRMQIRVASDSVNMQERKTLERTTKMMN